MIKKEVIIGDCRLLLGDCMEIMPGLGKADLVLTDPPYGINFGNFNRTNKNGKGERYKADKYLNSDWDKEFSLAPFIPHLFNLSDSLIIWGGNYFPELWRDPAKGVIFWNKHQPCKNFSSGELAWSNLDIPARHIDFPYYGNVEGKTAAGTKFHPTQKPVEVMIRCLEFSKYTETVVDPFAGSGTTGIACVKMGKKFIGIEREETYFDIMCKRIEEAYRQPDFFVEKPKEMVQEGLPV